jgi:hypothetical protein
MRPRYISLILLLAALFCIIAVITLYHSHEKQFSGNDRLIATVNGTSIFADDINKITKMIDVMNLNQLSDEQLRLAVQKHEINSFLSKIRQTIIEQKIKEYELTVSEQEIQTEIDSMFANIDSDKAETIIKKSSASFEALQQWQKEPSKSDSIYNDKLAGMDFRIDQWELLKITYDTPEKLQQMPIPKNIEDMKNLSYESAKNDLLYRKLMDKVANNDAKTEEEKTDAQKAWWKQQYNDAKIEILDPKYNEVLNILSINNR